VGHPKAAIQVTADSDPEVSKPAIQVTSDSGRTEPGAEASLSPCKVRTPSQCEPYRELIEAAVQRGRNAMAIFQDLVSDYAFAQSYQSVKRFVNKLQPDVVKEAHPVIITGPGEEVQVDYGTSPWLWATAVLYIYGTMKRCARSQIPWLNHSTQLR